MKKLILPILMLMPLIVSAATYEKVLNVFTGKFDYVNGKVSTSTFAIEFSTNISAPNLTGLFESTGAFVSKTVFYSSMTNIQNQYTLKSTFLSSMTAVEVSIRELILGATGVTYADFYGSMTIIESQYTNNSVFLDSMTRIDANFTPVTVFLASMTAIDANFTSKGVFFGSMTVIEGQYLSKSVFFSSMTESERIDATKINISSVATFEGLINDKLPASSGTAIANSIIDLQTKYSTTTISLVMVDTVTAGNLIGMYMPAVRIPFDCILKNAHIAIFDAAGDFVSGSATVLVSTASAGGTFGPCFTISTATASQGDYAPPAGTIDGVIPMGSYMRGAVTVFGTGFGLSVGVDIWKR